MIIGLIGFGKVSQNLVKLIQSPDIKFITSAENRSSQTLDNISKADITLTDTFRQVAIESDILISANSPKSAVDVSQKYGKYCSGIYLDLNNVSPETTLDINSNVSDLVDGAIIGKIDSENPTLYVSGKHANDLLFLNDFLDVNVVSDRAGDVSRLKMLRSAYTKTLSVLLIESFEIAKSNNLEDEFFEMLTLTEGDEFKEKSLSRITNTLKSSKRKSEELDEIIGCFSDDDLTMVKAALDKLNRL